VLQQFKLPLTVLLLQLAPCGYCSTPVSLPELSQDEPVRGFAIKCYPSSASFQVGKPVRVRCTITNKTKTLQPLLWSHTGKVNFCLNLGNEYPPKAGYFMESFPEINEALLVKSPPFTPFDIRSRDLIFYIPSEYSLTFHLVLLASVFHKPDEYPVRITYDPSPFHNSDSRSDPNEYRERYLTSDVFTLRINNNIEVD